MEGDNEVGFWPEGQQQPTRQADLANALQYVVEPEYLKTMRIPLLRGRFISEGDDEHSARIAVIDTSLAQKYFAGQDPIGKHINVLDFNSDPTQPIWMQLVVVGVVGHVKQWGLAADAAQPLQAQVYRPFMQASEGPALGGAGPRSNAEPVTGVAPVAGNALGAALTGGNGETAGAAP